MSAAEERKVAKLLVRRGEFGPLSAEREARAWGCPAHARKI